MKLYISSGGCGLGEKVSWGCELVLAFKISRYNS